jgi:hypothetical protein
MPAGTPLDLRGASLALRLGQQANHTLTHSGPLDFELVLEDTGGNRSAVRASAWTQLQAIYPSHISPPMAGLIETTKGVFETQVFPWWAFIADGRPLDLSQIRRVMIVVGQPYTATSGRIAVDDIEVWR